MRLAPDAMVSCRDMLDVPLASSYVVLRYLVSSPDGIVLDGVTENGELKTVLHIPAGMHQRAIKVRDFVSVRFVAKKFTVAHMQYDLSVGEQHDHEPPPPPPQPDNLLAQIREKVRLEMGVTREKFLENDTGLPGYERDDDDDDIFEEEEEIARKMAKEKSEKERAEKERKKDDEKAVTDDKTEQRPPSDKEKPAEAQDQKK